MEVGKMVKELQHLVVRYFERVQLAILYRIRIIIKEF
jgi:hypothetical protein